MKIKQILFLFGILISTSIFGQKITVVNNSTSQSIKGVSILIDNQVIKTDEKGELVISNVKNNSKITFKHPWYEETSLTLLEIEQEKWLIRLTEKVTSYDEMVISASKFEEKKRDVSQPIQVIRQTDLEDMNQSSTADVLANSGNVMVQKSQLGGGSPIIRGFETNKVLLVVDGVRMNNAIYRGGHLQNVVTLDNSSLEKIEIVYGPGSVVYGSDALGGVMHFYTKNPILSNSENTLVKGGAFTRYNSAATGYATNANISVGGQKFGSFTSISYSNFGDLRQGAKRNPFYNNFGNRTFYAERINGVDSMLVNKDTNLQVGSGYKQYDLTQKFLYQQNAFLSHTVNFQYSTSSDVPRYDRLTQMSGGKPKFAEWYYGPQKRLFSSYTLAISKKNRLFDAGRIILAYQNIEESRNDRKFNKNFLNSRVEKLDIFSLNADFEKKIGKNEIRFGAESYLNKVNSTASVRDIVADTVGKLDTRYPDGGSQMFSAAIYATHTLEISEKLILNDGIRFNYIGLDARFNDTTFFSFPFNDISQKNQAINGNIGLIFLPNDNWRINGIFSTGFRAPNVDDLSKVFESVPGKVIVPNPFIRPEFTYNFELGLSKTFHKKATLSVNGFYTIYNNAITVQEGQFNGSDSIFYDGQMSKIITTVNKSEAYIYGLEANLSANVTKNFSIVSNFTFTYGRIKTDTTAYPLDHIPPAFGKTSFSYKIKKFRGDFFVQYAAWKRIKDYNLIGEDNYSFATVNGMPSWFTINARATYQFSKALSLQVACENILDQNYRVFASNISAPGRNFILTLRGNF
jgi:hemoglobin/transferrin/lactoferrin receptor protein